jgi:polynucleotide kinase-phosphatase
MKLNIPELSLVVLIGASGSGKSTFARKHFKPTEIITSDYCRAIVSDDENDQTATKDAFELLKYIVSLRLKRGLLTVVDATNVQPEARAVLLDLARKYHCLPVAIVLDLPERVLLDRTAKRTDRNFGSHVVPMQRSQLKRSLKFLRKDGFRHIHILKSEEEVDAVIQIERDKLYNNLKHETGPFDLIGDIHGCFDELLLLLKNLGYKVDETTYDLVNYGFKVSAPHKRKAVFLGDLVDRGPATPAVLKLVMSMVNDKVALCVPGNHDIKLLKKLNGGNVQLKHGLEQSVEQLENETPEFIETVKSFLDGLISHYVLDGGNLVVAHAGLKEEMQGRGSGTVRSFCLYGETTGETDESGLPVRYNWAAEYKGKSMVVYGHTPVTDPQWLNKTICLDTGCVFGGKLTALRYPEKEIISVAAAQIYCQSAKPLDLNGAGKSAQQQNDDILDIGDVTGKRQVETSLLGAVTVREDNSMAALEVMSRFAVNPKWLIYLPPAMSPSETSSAPGMLEHPAEAFEYYRLQNVKHVICEEKHMGSRAVIVICKDEDAALKRFGITNEGIGVCYTRTGRNFFNDAGIENEFLARLKSDLSASGFWERFSTDWVCLDAELMPWSAKAQALLKDQYASVGAAAGRALPSVVKALEAAAGRGINTELLLNKFREKESASEKFSQAYRRYCWPVNSVGDYKLAPFHILATEGKVHTDKNHMWHMTEIERICAVDPGFLTLTNYKMIDTCDENSVKEGISWWLDLTAKGGEGMVVKPLDFITRGKKGIVQPAVKVRGKEYLRIIYGPDYDSDFNLERLRNRSLHGKRSLALREFSLGTEALERFVNKEPLRRVHECVFAVLALESEPVDPRL